MAKKRVLYSVHMEVLIRFTPKVALAGDDRLEHKSVPPFMLFATDINELKKHARAVVTAAFVPQQGVKIYDVMFNRIAIVETIARTVYEEKQ